MLVAAFPKPASDWAFGQREVVTVVWSSQPADYRDDELELVDDYDPELDLLDDLCDLDED